MKQYRCDVTGINENVWSSNGVKYDSIEAAQEALDSLSGRWFGYDRSRIVPADTPLNEPVKADDVLYQNFRKKIWEK